MSKVLTLSLICLILMIQGCDNETVVQPAEPSNFNVEFKDLPKTIQAPAGVTREYPFRVLVSNPDGSAATGIEVVLSVPSLKGSVIPAGSITDVNGQVDAIFSLRLTAGESNTQIIAKVSGRPIAATIQLIGSNPVSNIVLTTETPRMTVVRGQNARIDLKAVVTDAAGVGIPNVKLAFGLATTQSGQEIFGSISGDAFSDKHGMASVTFNSHSGKGSIAITCEVDEEGIEQPIFTEFPIEVNHLEDLPVSITIAAVPDVLYLHTNSTGTSNIDIWVRDASNVGIADLRLRLGVDHGTLSMPALTDSSGHTAVEFSINPAADFPSFEETKTVTIEAVVPGNDLTDILRIQVVPVGAGGSLVLTQDRHFIWADGPGLSKAILTARLRDSSGQPIIGEKIYFSTSFQYSTIITPMITDSLGVVKTEFDDMGYSSVDDGGNPDSVFVYADYREGNLTANVSIMIAGVNPVAMICLSFPTRWIMPGDSTNVRVTVYLTDGSPAPPGIKMHFEAIYGHFIRSVIEIPETAVYIAPRFPTTDTLHVWIETIDGVIVCSNEVIIDIISGPPNSVQVRSNPPNISPGETSIITATVLDSGGYPVREGTYVTFQTTLGMVTPSAVTDISGNAIATLTAGMESGIAVVTASVTGRSGPVRGTTEVVIGNGPPHTIQLSANPTTIQPAGSGGTETSVLTARILDQNGNPVQRASSVTFSLPGAVEEPVGPNLNDEGQQVIVQPINGMAIAYLNAGTGLGPVNVRALVWTGDDIQPDSIFAYRTVLISGGHPARIDLDIDTEGFDVGGGAWEIEVSANVADASGYPVADGVHVTFDVDPDIAVIRPAQTGSPNRRGVETPGIANTRLTYNSQRTFSPLEITARVQAPAGEISTARVILLPLQRGEMTLNVDPGNWMFEEGQEEAEIRVWAVLQDGHGVAINNAPILFTTNRGRFYWRDFATNRLVEYFPNPVRKLTGIQDQHNMENPGHATVILVATEPDVFLDPFTLEVTVRVAAVVEGYDDVFTQPQLIYFTRHGR